jgi:hypothetical protein
VEENGLLDGMERDEQQPMGARTLEEETWCICVKFYAASLAWSTQELTSESIETTA